MADCCTAAEPDAIFAETCAQSAPLSLSPQCGSCCGVSADDIVIEFDKPKSWPCCNYTCIRCDKCVHIHNDRDRVARIKSRVLRGALTLSCLSSEEALARGVSVLYAVCINGKHVMDLAAISCSFTRMKFDVSRANNSSKKTDPDTIAIKVGATNERHAGREDVYRRSPVMILAALKGAEWSAYRTAVVCAKTSNINVDGVYVRHAPAPGTVRSKPDARGRLMTEFAEAHQACVDIYAASSLQDQIAILEAIYQIRMNRVDSCPGRLHAVKIRKPSHMAPLPTVTIAADPASVGEEEDAEFFASLI
jgi:hypothetical protein